MLRILPAVLAATLTCGAAWAEPHEPAPDACVSMDTRRAEAHQVAEMQGGAAIDMEGEAAQKFLHFLNYGIGEPTDYKADRVGILGFPQKGVALVLMSTGPCGYGLAGVRLSYHDAVKAIAYAVGERL